MKKLFLKFYDWITGLENINWSRVVMQKRCFELINQVNPVNLKALEISGNKFQHCKFKSYESLFYPEFDICANPTNQKYDFVIAEQVFEHLLYPYKAGKNIYSMISDGGWFLISVPCLVAIHNVPVDCSRWTELGLKNLLIECGFSEDKVHTESWGNRKCVIANFDGWVTYRRRIHSLKNEPTFPYHVWALAQKS